MIHAGMRKKQPQIVLQCKGCDKSTPTPTSACLCFSMAVSVRVSLALEPRLVHACLFACHT